MPALRRDYPRMRAQPLRVQQKLGMLCWILRGCADILTHPQKHLKTYSHPSTTVLAILEEEFVILEEVLAMQERMLVVLEGVLVMLERVLVMPEGVLVMLVMCDTAVDHAG